MASTVIGRHLSSRPENWLALDVGAFPLVALYKLPILLAAASVFQEEMCAHGCKLGLGIQRSEADLGVGERWVQRRPGLMKLRVVFGT